jgi:hypothetical protein
MKSVFWESTALREMKLQATKISTIIAESLLLPATEK